MLLMELTKQRPPVQASCRRTAFDAAREEKRVNINVYNLYPAPKSLQY
jgi:hypothetical protein